MTFSCSINASLFARAALAVSAEETRYYLHGVNVESCPEGGALLIATDGRIMVAIRDPAGVVEGSAIVKLSPAMLKACGAKPPRGIVSGENTLAVRDQSAVVVYGCNANRGEAAKRLDTPDGLVLAAQVQGSLIDGSFPDWRRVVPQNCAADQAAPRFSPALYLTLAKALCTERTLWARLLPGKDSRDACLVMPDSAEIDGFGVLMPVRDDPVSSMPTWWQSRVTSAA